MNLIEVFVMLLLKIMSLCNKKTATPLLHLSVTNFGFDFKFVFTVSDNNERDCHF